MKTFEGSVCGALALAIAGSGILAYRPGSVVECTGGLPNDVRSRVVSCFSAYTSDELDGRQPGESIVSVTAGASSLRCRDLAVVETAGGGPSSARLGVGGESEKRGIVARLDR